MPRKQTPSLPVASAPDKGPSLADMARDRPGLVVGGALMVGLLAGALIPRGAAGKLARGAASAAVVGSEAGLTLARQARSAAGEAGQGARRLGRGTAEAASSAGSTALDLARAGLTLLASLKR